MEHLKVNGKEYEIIKLLGKGKSGYSYLVKENDLCFVIKKIHHEPCEYYTFGNKMEAEIHAYETLIRMGVPVPKLLETDMENECIRKEYIQGETIMDLVKEDKVKEVHFEKIKAICKNVYANGINLDYFPTNFVVKKDELYYIDYECNTYMDEWNFENWGIRYWSKTKEFMEYLQKQL